MSGYNMGLTLENIRTIVFAFLDILIMWLVIYYAIRIVRQNSRTIQIFKGIIFILIVDGIAKVLGLKTVAYMADIFVNWGFLAIIIIFQPEIRSLLERLGKSSVFSKITTLTGNEKEHLVDQIVTATMMLSKDQTGALISIEQSHPLDDYVATGTRINSDVSVELLVSLFVTSTPLHDGAVIIQGDKIACASAYFPPTTRDLPSRYGARHRAAIGISEITDAVTIVVSEETGTVSITENGRIYPVDRKQLRDYLLRVIIGEETEVHNTPHSGGPRLPEQKPETEQPAEPAPQQPAEEKLRTGNTGALIINKLALRRQNIKTEKIQAEEVTPPQAEKEPEQPAEPAGTAPAEPFAGSTKETDLRKLEEDAAQIKMPHHKVHSTPSYPANAAGNRFEAEKRKAAAQPESTPAAEAQEPQPDSPAEQTAQPSVQKTVQTDPESRPYYRNVQTSSRIPTEEVRPAQTPRNPERVLMDKEKMAEQERQFDTSKLDISKIVGFTDQLDKTFEILDGRKDQDSDKGGDN